jgi:hypothetical protein
MNMRIILPAAALVVGGAVLYGSTQASAFGGAFEGNMHSRLAEKLGLDESKIESAFDEMRAEHQAERQTQFEERLNQAVTDGEITEAQKQLILDKHEVLKAQHEADFENKGEKTREEWRAERQAHREEMESWADENGIDLKYFFGGMGKFGDGPGMGMHRGFGPGGQE